MSEALGTHLSKPANLAEADGGSQQDENDNEHGGVDICPEGEQDADGGYLGGNLRKQDWMRLTESELP